MAQNDFLDKHVQNITGARLTFDALIDKLNTDVYGREMRTDISTSVKALGNAINEVHENNGTGVGWTDYQIDLLETILKAAAYADTGIGDEINRLIASLRGASLLVGLQVSPDTVTVNAGDDLDSIRDKITVTATFTDGYEKEYRVLKDNDYYLDGFLIQGKNCPVSVSYTSDGFTISKTITVTVRERVPNSMTARFFGNKDSLFVGTTTEEVKDSIYVDVLYNDGYQERTTDFTVYGSPAVVGLNHLRIALNTYPSTYSELYFTGIDPDTVILGFNAATIDYLLEECTSSYTNDFIETGRAFSTTIATDKGTVKSISVFVDGVSRPDMIDGNTITINSVYIKNRSRIVISAINNNLCTVTYHLTNCTSSNTVESVSYKGAFLTVISPNDGYELDLEKTYIIMGSSKISSTNGTFSILGVTNNIDVYGVANPESSGEVTLSSISAVYTGGAVPAGTTLSQLTGIVVTAMYSDGSTGTVTGYTLSGNLTAGKTNTITVTYQGKTATFEVTVEASEATLSSISVAYTGGSVAAGTTLEQLTGITVTANYSDGSTSTISSSQYSLSGVLTPGQTNTITVSYSGKTATFEVTVEAVEETENYTLKFLEPTGTSADPAAGGVQTFGENQTYTTVSDTIRTNAGGKISEKITYKSSKVYTITVTPATNAVRFQLAYFDASDNLSGYSTWGASGDISDLGTTASVFTLRGTTLTRDKGGNVTSETQSMGAIKTFAIYCRSKVNLITHPERLTVTMSVADA